MSEITLDHLLLDFVRNTHGVQSAIVVTREGFVVTSVPDGDCEAFHIGALSAIITSSCENMLGQLHQGSLDACLIQGSDGKFVLMGAGENGMMITILQEDSHPEAIYTEMRKISQQISGII